MAEIWVFAHSDDFSRVAVSSFIQAVVLTATPFPNLTPTATPSPSSVSYVLGYVVNVVEDAGTIKVAPVEGLAEIINVTPSTEILRQGQPVQLSDIRLGDLVEASGQTPPAQRDRMVAAYVHILTGPTDEPTATATATSAPLFWEAEYYSNTTFSGNPSLTRQDPVVDFQWQSGPPADGLPADNFAVRWTGSWPFESGGYRFRAQVDDGVRLWLDDHLVIDQWHQSTGALYDVDAYVSSGIHTVRVEYFEAQGNAYARVWWDFRGSDAVLAYPDWAGEYYSNMTLSGPPFLVVNERTLDHDWGAGAPASGIPSDGFSVRWTRTANFEEGNYRFYARSDDGVRVWVDERQVINQWQDGGATTYAGEAHLPSGEHGIRVEYYENAGQAVIRVWWELLPETPTPTGTATETPTQTPELPTPTPTESLTPVPQNTPLTPQPTSQVTPQSPHTPSFVVYFPHVELPRREPQEDQGTTRGRLGGPVSGW
jgi:hypothetical protein